MSEPFSSDRRRFIRNFSLGIAGLTFLPSFSWMKGDNQDETIRLVILHTNDMHSHIDPFPANDTKYPDQGGMARRAALIEQIRKENEHVLLLDAGDVFQGTPYFNFFGGIPEFKLMSQMGYDAATMGNHDFDNGLEGFSKALPYARFPFICSNYDFSETLLAGKTLNNMVIEKGDIKIGIFGLGVELEGLVMKKNYGSTKYLDPLKVCEQQVKLLREDHKCDYIICLSHLGYSYNTDKISDMKLAASSKGINLIIGGHTHTFLDKAQEVTNSEGKITLVNQVGWAGLRLGRIDLNFRKIHGKKGQEKEIAYITGSNLHIA